MDCTTAKASLAVNTELWIEERFEGQDLQLLKKGTANAEKLTIGFWVKATKTGTYILSIYDNDNTRQCSISYTVSSGDTWEYKIVNFPADTTGVLDNDNALYSSFCGFLPCKTEKLSYVFLLEYFSS